MAPRRNGTLRDWCATVLLAFGTLLGGPWHAALLHANTPAHPPCEERGGPDGHTAEARGRDAGSHAHHATAGELDCALCALTGLRRAPRMPRIANALATGVVRVTVAPERPAPVLPGARPARGPPSIA